MSCRHAITAAKEPTSRLYTTVAHFCAVVHRRASSPADCSHPSRSTSLPHPNPSIAIATFPVVGKNSTPIAPVKQRDPDAPRQICRPWTVADNGWIVRKTLAMFGPEGSMFASNFSGGQPVRELRDNLQLLSQKPLRPLAGCKAHLFRETARDVYAIG